MQVELTDAEVDQLIVELDRAIKERIELKSQGIAEGWWGEDFEATLEFKIKMREKLIAAQDAERG